MYLRMLISKLLPGSLRIVAKDRPGSNFRNLSQFEGTEARVVHGAKLR